MKRDGQKELSNFLKQDPNQTRRAQTAKFWGKKRLTNPIRWDSLWMGKEPRPGLTKRAKSVKGSRRDC